jgi:hypothetical protein
VVQNFLPLVRCNESFDKEEMSAPDSFFLANKVLEDNARLKRSESALMK